MAIKNRLQKLESKQGFNTRKPCACPDPVTLPSFYALSPEEHSRVYLQLMNGEAFMPESDGNPYKNVSSEEAERVYHKLMNGEFSAK